MYDNFSFAINSKKPTSTAARTTRRHVNSLTKSQLANESTHCLHGQLASSKVTVELLATEA